jgi:hypothetical protein
MKLIALLLVLGLQACVSGARVSDPIGPTELKSNADHYDGQNVVVRGYVLLGTNGRSLCQSKQLFDEWTRALDQNAADFEPRDYDNLCLTMLNADLLQANAGRFDKTEITVTGMFVRDYMADGETFDLQAWGVGAIILDERDVRRLVASRNGH